jgi:hypothetical protein
MREDRRIEESYRVIETRKQRLTRQQINKRKRERERSNEVDGMRKKRRSTAVEH